MSRAGRAIRRRGATLIESVLVVVVVAMAAPVTLQMLREGEEARLHASGVARASTLATLVVEHVLADVSSSQPGLGPAALEDPDAYLDSPATGLRARLATTAAAYQAMGLTYAVTIGPLTAPDGRVSGDAGLDRYRTVTVEVRYRTPRRAVVVPLSVIVNGVDDG